MGVKTKKQRGGEREKKKPEKEYLCPQKGQWTSSKHLFLMAFAPDLEAPGALLTSSAGRGSLPILGGSGDS